jgi:ribonucleoside-diphosphate reductase alpha chain
MDRRTLTEKGMSDDEIRRTVNTAWRTAQEISVEDHVRMQAAFQRHSDSAVSKTINLHKDATEKEVAEAYRLAYRLGCKGITIFRDQSRGTQVLERPTPPTEAVRGAACPDC